MKCIIKYAQKNVNISDFRVFCGYLLKRGKKVKILNEQLDMLIYNVLSENTVLLKEEAETICGKPDKPRFTDRPVAVVKWVDGTLLDTVWQVDSKTD